MVRRHYLDTVILPVVPLLAFCTSYKSTFPLALSWNSPTVTLTSTSPLVRNPHVQNAAITDLTRGSNIVGTTGRLVGDGVREEPDEDGLSDQRY